jgi:hypothetical protein
MTKFVRQLLPVILLSVLLTQCSKDDDTPASSFEITSLNPESGAIGTAVTITGKGFKTGNILMFNGTEAVIQVQSATQLITNVPAGATTGALTIHDGAVTSTGPVFTVTEPQVTKTYFYKFKVNGTTKIFEDSNPGYQSCGDCACSYLPVLSEASNASIDICLASNDWITAGDIQSWNNKKILFSDANIPNASFGFRENNVNYDTYNAPDQTGSEVNITSVVSDGSFSGDPAYKVSGNFKCKVAKDDGTGVVSVTEGTFVIRYTQD